jgi:hypothetical protein
MPKLDKLALEEVVDLLEKKDFKKKLIKVLNKNIDVPIFNEKTEAKVLDTFYTLLLKTIKDMADE